MWVPAKSEDDKWRRPITRSLQILLQWARSIFHQVGATEVAQPELTTLVNFDDVNGANPAYGSLIADAHGDLFGTTEDDVRVMPFD